MPALIQEEINQNDPAFLYLNLHPGEEIKFIVRHHWAGFLGTLLIVIAMALFPIFGLFIANLAFGSQIGQVMPIIIIALSSYFIFLLTFLFGTFINYYFDIILITNQRIINVDQQGLLARRTSELNISEVEDANAEVNGFLRSLFNFGTLVIETAGKGTSDEGRPGMHGYFTIDDLPDPNRLARTILEFNRIAIAETNDPNQ